MAGIIVMTLMANYYASALVEIGDSALAGNVGASVVARWQGDGVLTLLAPARWCRKRSDPTINMRCKG